MSFNPLVSIIIPVFNGANYLAEAVESAINQTYRNIEIIVVNDGSTDAGATREAAFRYKDIIKYYEKENGGVASAFNYGISKMHGDYFSWLSHDDKYLSNKVEIQIKVLSGLDKNTILFSNYLTINENSSITGRSRINFSDYDNLRFFILFKRPFINGNTILIPRNAFEKVGLFDESLEYTQDYDMWFRLAETYPFYFLETELIMSRIHPNQGSKINCKFKEESVKLKYNQLKQVNISELNSFTRTKSVIGSYIKIGMISYFHGGDENEFPLIHLKRIVQNECTFKGKIIINFVFSLLNSTLILPNRIRRKLVIIFLRFSKTSIIRLLLNE